MIVKHIFLVLLLLFASTCLASAETACAESPHSSELALPDLEEEDATEHIEPAATVEPAVLISKRPALRPCKFRQFEVGRQR
ncbi:hypothetical protein OU790_17705, partial [Ruegeria sp. NA]